MYSIALGSSIHPFVRIVSIADLDSELIKSGTLHSFLEYFISAISKNERLYRVARANVQLISVLRLTLSR